MSSDYRPHPRQNALKLCACSPSTIRVLEEPFRRAILRVLLERTPVSTTELSSLLTLALASDISDGKSLSPDSVAIELHHTHLPKLVAAGLITVDEDRGVLSLRTHPDVDGGPLTKQRLTAVGQAQWDVLATIHTDSQRSELLKRLDQSEGTETLSAVATALAEANTPESVPACPDEIAISLHHYHLPVLEEAGVVTYDASAHEISYAGTELFSLSELASALR
ncbi:hypothetical protein [Haloferax sp. DFSO60]|uniref:DUF7344 domain-containing protein n=1 Tax=Haloferax sp. DFSO60 TaxID=3388652 RepID=UPI0039787972